MRELWARTGVWTTRRSLSLLGTLLIGLFIAVDAWYIWPSNLGGATSFVVVSGSSMEPTYYTGDLVIARESEAAVGDVIVYAPEGYGGAQIVHRIVGGTAADGWVMQGDNNNYKDPFTPKGDEVKGVVMVHYANVGRITAFLLNPLIWAFLILAAIVILVWTSGDDYDEEYDDDRDDEHNDDVDVEADETPAEIEAFGVWPELQPVASHGAADAPRHAVTSPDSRLTGMATSIVAALAGAALLIVGAGATPAAASAVTVSASATAKAMQYSPCSAATWQTTVAGTATAGNYTQVRVSNIQLACQGIPATIYVHNAAGATLATATFTPGASSVDVTVPSYSAAAVTTVMVRVNGWPMRTAWTPPGAPVPAFSCVALNAGGNTPGGATCTVSNVQVSTWQSGGYEWATIQMTVTSSHINSRTTLNLSQAPFPGWTPLSLIGNGDFVSATIPAPAYSCAQLPVLQMNRNVGNGSTTLYFQMTTQPNAFPWALDNTRICP